MNTLFKNINVRKIMICDKNIHKAIQIPVDIYQRTEKLFVTVQQKNACKLEFADHLWLPYLDQTQYDIVVFAIIPFHIYNILVTKWNME